MKKYLLTIIYCILSTLSHSQTVKVLFSANKGEQAGNADWVIDADVNNLWVTNTGTYSTTGDESNPSRTPTPAQSGITTSTSETYWTGGISALAVECVKLGYIVESLPISGQITYGNTSNPQDLSNYRIYVVCEPNIVFTASEKTAIMNYVQNGGRLLMVADHETSDRNFDGWEARSIWNDLMFNNSVNSNNPFGMKFDSVNISQTSSNYTASSTDTILNSSQYGSVTQMKFSNGTTLTINPSLNSTVKGHFYSTGANRTTTNAWVASCRYGKGKVVGFGDSSPFDDGTGDPNDVLYDGWIADASGNHKKIIMNSMLWLAKLDSFYVSISSSKPKICFSMDSTTLTATQGVSYLWSNGKTTQSIKVYSGGVYSVSVINSLGQQTSASITVVEFPRPNPVVTISGTTVKTTNTFLTYQWYKSPSTLIAGANSYQYTPTSSETLYVYVKDSNGCQDTSNKVNFTYAGFSASITKNKDSICQGDSILLTASAGTSYSWSTGANSSSIYVKSSGSYSVTVTNSSAVTASSSMNVFFYSNPTPIVSSTGNILSTSSMFATYQWYNSNAIIPSANQYQYSPPASGQYKVIVTDAHGCSGSSPNFTFSKLSIQSFENSSPTISYQGKILNIDMNKKGKYSLEIYDLTGKIILEKQFLEKGNFMIELSENSVYVLKIISENLNPFYYKLSIRN